MEKRNRKRTARTKAALRRRPLVGEDRRPVLEAISVVVQPAPGRDGMALARQVARRAKLTGWRIEPVVEDGCEVELLSPPRRPNAARAWDHVYALRDQPEVVDATPMFRYLVPENAPPTRTRRSSGGGGDDLATATEYDWSLRKANVLEAWRLFGAQPPGSGVQVGHPDTGYTMHPELAEPARILVSAGYDYDDGDPNAIDDLDDGFLDNPSHGTGTGSVILSGVGAPNGGPGPFVSGAAPHALLIPIRTTESVVLLSMRGLRQAVDHATTHGAQVISMSLGGPFPGFGTRRAIQRAVDAGAIVLAAAGNEVGFVTFPAAFEEVIAVAASNIRDVPWTGSCHGPAVDITAPGESVWRARTVRNDGGGESFLVERGNGTSFAVATMAGVAALWVSYHGWPTLVRKFGAGNIARVFKDLVQSTCRTPRGWDTHEYGPGIVDAKALLNAPLPDAAPARKFRDVRRAPVAVDSTGLETLVHLLPEASRAQVEESLAALLQVPDRDLSTLIQQYGDELAFQLVMHPALLRTLGTGPRGARAAVKTRFTVTRGLKRAGLSARLKRQLAR